MLQDLCTILQRRIVRTGRTCGIGYDRQAMPASKTSVASLTPADGPYREMASIIDRFAIGDGEFSTAIGSLFLSRRSQPTDPVRTAQWPCFALVVQGEKSLGLGAELYRYGVGDYLIVSVDLPVVSRVTRASSARPHLGLGMAIAPDRLNEVLGRFNPLRSVVTPAGVMRGVSVNTAPADLVDASLRLLRLLDRPEDITAMAPLIEQEILYRLLTGPFGPHLLQMAMAETPSNRIARAIARLRENFARPLRIEALAEHAGMSVSSLHHHFKAVAAMTPMQYQKQLRLHEARRLMLIEKMDVGSAGYSVGYQSPSQFSREYSRLYGRPPLRDVGFNREQAKVA